MTVQDFDQANAYGAEGEAIVRGYGRAMAAGETYCEVKRKSRTDPRFYIETAQKSRHGEGDWVPGGVNATDAPLFSYVLADTGIVVTFPTALLREAVTIMGKRKEQPQRHQGNPTVGALVDLLAILERYEPDGSGFPVPAGGWKETEEF